MLIDQLRARRGLSITWAFAASLLVHALILFVPRHPAPITAAAATRLNATLPRPTAPIAEERAPERTKPVRNDSRTHTRILAMDKPTEPAPDQKSPAWTIAERSDMERFLSELDNETKAAGALEQRSLATAAKLGRHQTEDSVGGEDLVERAPDSPPVDPFSLEMYLDSVLRKLNRSAAFVRNDPRSRGLRAAKVRVRFDPSGSLRSFRVLYAGDQQDEISFVKSVVELAIPFAAFPPDILRSATSLALDICILPASAGGGGFGFTRSADGHGC